MFNFLHVPTGMICRVLDGGYKDIEPSYFVRFYDGSKDEVFASDCIEIKIQKVELLKEEK